MTHLHPETERTDRARTLATRWPCKVPVALAQAIERAGVPRRVEDAWSEPETPGEALHRGMRWEGERRRNDDA